MRAVRVACAILVAAAAVFCFSCPRATAQQRVNRVAHEFVAVAHVDPLMVIAVNVFTGRLKVSGDDVGTPELGVIGIHDPVRGNELFRYRGGIPGLVALTGRTSLDSLPVWGPPRWLHHGGSLTGLRLADDRLIAVRTDREGRLRMVEWPGAHGGRLRSTISYAGARTMIVDPSGIQRTYVHDRDGDAFERVPKGWRGPGYRRSRVPILDGKTASLQVQARTDLAPDRSKSFLDIVQAAAGRTFGEIWFGAPASDGYLNVGVTSASTFAGVNAVLARLGLLDITTVSTVFNTAHSLNAVQNALNRPLKALFYDCHLSDGQQVDDVDISIASTISAPEIRLLTRSLHQVHAWAVLDQGGPSECLTAQAAATPTTPGQET